MHVGMVLFNLKLPLFHTVSYLVFGLITLFTENLNDFITSRSFFWDLMA